MTTKIEIFNQTQLKKNLPDIRPGDTVKVYQRIKESPKSTEKASAKGKKEKDGHQSEAQGRIQVFEGVVLAKKHGKGISSTITVRKVIDGIGVERIFPLHSPVVEKIEILKRSKVRRAKLYYLRETKGKKSRLKIKEFSETISSELEVPIEEELIEEKETTIEEKPIMEEKK